MTSPTRRLPVQTEALRQSEFLSLSERMSRDLSSFGHEQRRESDALSLENIGIQLPEDGGITGTTGYESLLEAPPADETSQMMASEAPDDYEALTAQPRSRMTQPTVGMPQIDTSPSEPIYNPTQTTEIQSAPDYDPTEAAGTVFSGPSQVPQGSSAGPSQVPQGSVSIQGKFPEEQARIYQQARASGLDDEGARVLVSVSETEGGARGAAGDNGNARGVYQFHEQGEMPAFRAWVRKNGIEGDPNQLAVDPEVSTRYAAEGYLGQAIARGRELGYRGAELATYVQRTGQRSIDPGVTGANYTRLFAPTQRPAESRAQAGETRLAGITPAQFGLGDADADAICGPVLAMAFARSTGRNPTIAEAKQLAAQHGGWTSAQGMGGPEAMAQTLRSMGIPAAYKPGALDIDTIRRETAGGNPVGINTAGHYFVIEGVDEQGRLDLGNSAKALRASGGRQWFRPDEIAGLGMGAPTGAIYKDAPSSPTPSLAVSETKLPPVSLKAGVPDDPTARREADALSLAADVPSSADAPGGGSSPPTTGSSALDDARASTSGGSVMLRDPLSQQPELPPGEQPGTTAPLDPDQGPRETGYTLPQEPPIYDNRIQDEAPGARELPNQQPIISPLAPAENPGVSVTAASPAPPRIQFTQGGPPTPSAQWTPVETRPRVTPAPEPQQVTQQSMAPPGLQPVWDAAGTVVGYVQGAAQGAVNQISENMAGNRAAVEEANAATGTDENPLTSATNIIGNAVAPFAQPMGGMNEIMDRMQQIQEFAMQDTGRTDAAGWLVAVRDPGFRQRHPDLADEYSRLQSQLGLVVGGQAGDTPRVGRQGPTRALPETRPVSGEVVPQTGAARGEVIPPATDAPSQAWGIHHQVEALQQIVDETPPTSPERPALVGRLNEAKNQLGAILEDVEGRLDDASEAVREADRGWFENPRQRGGRAYDEIVGEPQAELDLIQQERAQYPPSPRSGPVSKETQAAARAGETGAAEVPLPAARVVPPRPLTNAERVAAADARVAEQGSTTASGMFGPQPAPGPRPRRRTVEVIQEQIDHTRRVAADIDPSVEPELAQMVRERDVRLQGELADALNARRNLEPAITSDVGRRLETLRRSEVSADDLADAMRPRQTRTDPSELSGPVGVPVVDPRSRLNTTTGPSAPAGAGRLAQVNADLGNAVFGGVTGATAGAALPADTDEERRQNALIGAGVGMAGFPIAGRMLPRGPAGARMAVGPQGAPERPARAPGRTFAFGAKPGERVEFNVKVVPLSSLITSHTDNLAINPAFPSELQPRVRERAASRVQIDGIINRFDPDQMLIDTHTVDRGPMIVGPDNVVESGNGRSIALRRLAQEKPDEYARYVAALRDELPQYGLSEDALRGIDQPVLVRERVSDVDRAAFAADANVGVQHDMSPIEEAMQDAGRLSDGAISRLVVGENQTIDEALLSGENGDFRRAFMASLPESVRSGLLDADGNLNAKGLARAKAALLVKTYPGSAGNRLATAFVESTDPGVSNVRHAINASLPTMARAEAKIAAGDIDPSLSLAQDVAAAADVYSRLRRAGTTIGDYLAQASMFSARETSPLQDRILGYLSDNARSPRKMRALLEDYARTIEGETGGVDMFGDAIPTRSKDEVLDDVLRRLGSDADPSADLGRTGAGSPVVAEPGVGSVPVPESGTGAAPSGSARSQPSIDLPAAPPSPARPAVAPAAPRPGPVPEGFAPSGGPEGALAQEGAPPRLAAPTEAPRGTLPSGGPEGALAQEGAPTPLAAPTQAERGTLPTGGPEEALRQQPGVSEETRRLFAERIRDPEKADAAAVAYQDLIDSDASPATIATFLRNSQDSRWWDRFDTLRYASMLSDPVTHGQNFEGSAVMGGVDVLERPLTALLDKGRAAVTGGPRDAFMSEAAAQMVGMAHSAKQGIKDAAFIMAHGLRPEDAAKLDKRARGFGTNIPGIAPRGSRAANAVDFAAEGPLRALSAADAFWRGTFKGGHLEAEAERAARVANDGKPVTPEQARAFLTDPEVAKRADERAAQAVLQEDRRVTSAINAGRNKLPPLAQAAVSVAVPYIKTPYNIVAQGLGMTPAGIGPLIADIRAGKAPREIERRVSRMLVGGAVMAWASLENMAGLNTGAYPEKESERSTLPPGWRPYSRKIQVGGETYYVPLALLGPVGIPAMVSILATEQYKKGNGFTGETAAKFAEGMGQLAEDQTFLRSISDFNQAIAKGGNTAMNYVERQASQFSPHVIGGGGIGRRVQAIMGEPARDPDGVVQAWLSTLPYGDQLASAAGVEPAEVRRDVLGRPSVTNPEGAAALMPIRASRENDAAVIRAYRKAGEGLPRAAPKTVRDPETDEPRALSRHQQGRWQVEFGRAVREEWSDQGNPTDKDTLQKVEAAARKRATASVLGQ